MEESSIWYLAPHFALHALRKLTSSPASYYPSAIALHATCRGLKTLLPWTSEFVHFQIVCQLIASKSDHKWFEFMPGWLVKFNPIPCSKFTEKNWCWCLTRCPNHINPHTTAIGKSLKTCQELSTVWSYQHPRVKWEQIGVRRQAQPTQI